MVLPAEDRDQGLENAGECARRADELGAGPGGGQEKGECFDGGVADVGGQ